MWYFFFASPGTWLLIGLAMIVGLVWMGVRHLSQKVSLADNANTPSWKEINKQLGPMTWQEHIVSAVLILLFVAIVVWIASVT